jgi:hypothetical protein
MPRIAFVGNGHEDDRKAAYAECLLAGYQKERGTNSPELHDGDGES